jgi:AmmeMemoRadiSam system protein A
LLGLARAAITEAVVHRCVWSPPAATGRLGEPAGAFVSLHHRSRLRGCVGLTSRDLSLGETVAQCAIGAALHDSRFSAIGPDEVSEIEIEISVLSELRRLPPRAIEIGRHGLLIIRGSNRGVLLPKVAAERGWPAVRFLEETCRKAGLDPDAWRDPEAELLAFTAEVFSDRDFAAAEGGAALHALEEHTPAEETAQRLPALEKAGSKP